MKITPTDLPEVLIIEPDVHKDDRGFFVETWHAEKYAAAGLDARFVQDNHSRSSRGIRRLAACGFFSQFFIFFYEP